MRAIVFELRRPVKRRLQALLAKTKDAGLRTRVLIILHLARGKSTADVAEAVHYDPSAVRKVRTRFLVAGEAGLLDARRDNGRPKVDADLLAALHDLLAHSPQDFRWHRRTWTQELLARTLAEQTGVAVSPSTVARMLSTLGARWGAPKPIVACWWPKAQRQRRLREIEDLIEHLPRNEVVVYEDEVDIDLNPRLGRDWMQRGTQRLILTPGKNEKHYLAGALNPKTGEVLYVNNGRKNAYLFRLMLDRLGQHYAKAKRIHVVLDNYGIHQAKAVLKDLEVKHHGRIVLHFLPPYCPDHNRIERLWRELHANVTRHHRCKTLKQLLANVYRFLDRVAPYPGTRASLDRAAA